MVNRFLAKAIALSFGLGLILSCLPGLTQQYQTVAQLKTHSSRATASNNKKEAGVDFSGTGRPGQQTAGESRGSCPQSKIPLTALIPTFNSGKTIAQRPNFWVYIPYHSNQISSGEFVLQDEQRRDVYRTKVNLNDTPGYLRQSLPTNVPALEIGKWYVWYFKLYCDPSESSSPLFVQGWIQRVALNSRIQQELKQHPAQLEQVYATNNLWYDAINSLNHSYFTQPDNVTKKNNWLEVLQSKTVQLDLPTLTPVIQTMK